MGDFNSGVWPVMLTAFTREGSIDLDGLDALTDWYIESGVAGLFSVCLSSEMYHLTDEERIILAERVVRRSDGRVPVVASGTFEGEVKDQAQFVKRMAETGVDGVVALVCQLANEADNDTIWQANAEELLDTTGDIRMGLYECPAPYHRVLSSELTAWCASTGRFHFIKETSADVDLVKSKIEACQDSSLGIYPANEVILLSSLRSGADGYCGTMANFYPDLHAWLCHYYEDEPEAAERLQRFLSVIKAAAAHKYSASAKRFLGMLGLPITDVCRDKEETFRQHELVTLENLHALVEEYRVELGIVSPAIA